MRHPGRLPAAIALTLLCILLAAGCGGDGDETTTAAPATDAGAEVEDTSKAGKDGKAGKKKESKAKDEDNEQGQPSGSNGGSGSLEDFGEPADADTAREMRLAVRSYFSALADGDPAAACEWLAEAVIEQIEQATEQVPTQNGAEGCEGFLSYAAQTFSGKNGPDYSRISYSDFRVDGDQGLVIYRIPDRPKLMVATALEDEGWRMRAIDGSPIP